MDYGWCAPPSTPGRDQASHREYANFYSRALASRRKQCGHRCRRRSLHRLLPEYSQRAAILWCGRPDLCRAGHDMQFPSQRDNPLCAASRGRSRIGNFCRTRHGYDWTQSSLRWMSYGRIGSDQACRTLAQGAECCTNARLIRSLSERPSRNPTVSLRCRASRQYWVRGNPLDQSRGRYHWAGSGLYGFRAIENARQKTIKSLWSKPSALPRVGEIGATPVGRPWSALTKVPAEKRV